MKKKVGIVTYWITQSNYGSVLQNYALQTFLHKFDFEPFLIRNDIAVSFSRWKSYKEIFISKGFLSLVSYFIKRFFYNFLSLVSFQQKKDSRRKFEDFIDKNLNSTKVFKSLDELKLECPNAKLYIAGSDQIWNTYGKSYDLISPSIKSYLLSFAPKEAKKIACAASFGSSSFDSEFENLFKSELSKFDFISCREKTGVEICKKLGFENAAQQPDPTLLLSCDEYKKIADYELVPKNPYILLYLLGNNTDFSIGKLKKFAESKNLEVVYVPANEFHKINFHKKIYPTVNEWLGLYEKASFVVTNSFHGTVFSLIFNKPFLTVKQAGDFSSQNARIDSLLEYFSLQNRFFDGDLEKLSEPIDFKPVNQKMKEVREASPFVDWMKKYILEDRK